MLSKGDHATLERNDSIQMTSTIGPGHLLHYTEDGMGRQGPFGPRAQQKLGLNIFWFW